MSANELKIGGKIMAKLNNASFGTYKSLYFNNDGTKKKLWNEKYSDELIIKCIKEFYITGISSKKIDEKYNLPKGTVSNWIVSFKYGRYYKFYCEGGICDQLKGIINLKDYVCLELPNSRKRVHSSKYMQIKDMYLQGYSYEDIRNKLGVNDSTITHIRRRFNLPRRRPEYHTLDFMW